MKRKYKGFVWVLILSICTSLPVAAQENKDKPMNLYAQSAVLMDADTGRILFGKNENEVRAMASTTKIMTCILVLENMEDNQTVIVGENASRQPKVRLGMRVGEEYDVKDLLYSLMLESHNDSAVALAEGIAGSVEQFALLMNQKAKELDCNNTYFVTPNGLDESDDNGFHSTTAADLSKIMKYCILESPKSKQFLEITQKMSYDFTDKKGNRNFICNNHNVLLQTMKGVISGKTGFTNQAGYCYVGAMESEGRTYIVTLLGAGWPNNRNYKWIDAGNLLEYGMNHYDYEDIELKRPKREIQVEDGWETDTVLVGIKDNQACILKNSKEQLQIKTVVQNKIKAPVMKETVVGKVYWYIGDTIVHTEKLYTLGDVEESSLKMHLKKILRLWCIDDENQVC